MTLPATQQKIAFALLRDSLDLGAIGSELHDRIRRLYPICRSITGDGVRKTLEILAQEIEIETDEVSTGTAAFDWTIPKEWNIRDAYIKSSDGTRIVDFNASNLHVVNYSTPVRGRLSLAELRPHLHSIPDHPDWIPYKTSYYSETWGFCLSDRQLQSLDEDEYEVCIDSSLEVGHLTLGQCVLPGREAEEVLISCHVCHPSLCNDNLSGVSVAVTLARLLEQVSHRYTYRFVFTPATIGAIAWLSRHRHDVERVRHGLVLACVGDRGKPTYKRSRRGTAVIDRAVTHVLQRAGGEFEIKDFSPYGYDERQYCSPGFNLPVGLFSRTPHGCFPEYHTSADNLDFVDPASLADTLCTCLKVFEVIEGDAVYVNKNPKCEPQLGKRGLFGSVGGHGVSRQMEAAFLWILNFSDGDHSLLDIAERSGISFAVIRAAADALIRHDLLDPVGRPTHEVHG
jgi:aminopeptidase-like protein